MSVILGKYQVEKLLGKGNFGKVFLASDMKTGVKYAIKQMGKARLQKQSHLIEYLNGEIECMRMIKSHHVMELHDVAEDNENKYMICGYCNGGNLFDYQAKMLPGRVIPLEKTMEIVSQILKGLQAIHSEGYLHRDLKPENVLVETEAGVEVFAMGTQNFRIADFGFARREEKTTGTILGTGKFMAPEIYEGEKYEYGVDMWAIGVTIYYMLNGEYPFNPAPKRQIMDIKAKLPFSYAQNVKKSARKLLGNCNEHTESLFLRIFELNPSKRMSFHDLKSHPLLAEHFKQDQEYEDSLILYNKAFKPKNIMAPVEQIDEGDEQSDQGTDYKSHIVPKNDFTKQIEELQFYFQHKEFILNLSDLFRTEGKYLSKEVKYALRYNLLKFYIIEATALFNLFRKKSRPDQTNPTLNWVKFFDSKEFKIYLNALEENITKANAKFEDSYNDCKDNMENILKEIPEFKESFSPIVSEKEFSEFKKSFRGTTNRANKVLSAIQNDLTAKGQQPPSKLIELRIRIFICHILNQVFKKEDIPQNFSYYFEWKKHQKLDEPVDQFNFETFAMWIGKDEKNNLIKTIALIMKKYFGSG